MKSIARKEIIIGSGATDAIIEGCSLLKVSVPFAKGELADPARLLLKQMDGKALLPQWEVLNRWSDGSIKWLQCLAVVNTGTSSGNSLFLQEFAESKPSNSQSQPFSIISEVDCFHIRGEHFSCTIDRQQLRPFSSVTSSIDSHGESTLILKDGQDQVWVPIISHSAIVDSGPLRVSVHLTGDFSLYSEKLLRFYANLDIYPQYGYVDFRLRLHNPKAASHPHNLWDLGDPGSVLLKQLALVVPRKQECCCNISGLNPVVSLAANCSDRLILYQESSGGCHWDSPVHRNRNGDVPMTFRGWRLWGNEQLLQSGERCQPQVWSGTDVAGVTVEIHKFWQRFPKALSVTSNTIELGLLPEEFPDLHELQGGEQLTERMTFHYGVGQGQVALKEVPASCTLATYQESGVFAPPLFAHQEPRSQALLGLAFDTEKGFFAKREQLDEYGWRNFGDVYADHETAFHDLPSIFVSHYNNQYDLMASCYREFLVTSDSRWADLAADLAAHVADIDINQTIEDREEYSLGPFWHTDHYLDAGLSTHRMASKIHLDKKPAHLCGGGPAAEMCYISGLSLHYLLTGDSRYRDLVVQLANWNWLSLNGVQTVGAAILRTIKNIRRLKQGREQNVVFSRYPFTRGTGNCLNSQLEALELTQDLTYLRRAEQLIVGTIHPQDDPVKRNLLNAEIAWSYTVFLMTLGRYLQIKQEREEFDEMFSYAKDCLAVYADWMLENEYPYLEKPDILEFPNDTWVAQDLRKSAILYYASCYRSEPVRSRLLSRADFFKDYVLSTLAASDSAHYSRIQALVMQNCWVVDALNADLPHYEEPESIKAYSCPKPWLTVQAIILLFVTDMGRALKHFRFQHEKDWLMARFQK